MLTLKRIRLLIGGCLLVFASLAHSVGGADWEVENKGDSDYEAAVKAVERKDWQSAVAALQKVIKRRAWDDDAHTLLGFAYRKLGNYQASLEHYHRALELNPYHRGALEYLGEAYLELGAYGRASAMLERLAAACRRVSKRPSADTWKESCPEWHELKAAIGARSAQTESEN